MALERFAIKSTNNDSLHVINFGRWAFLKEEAYWKRAGYVITSSPVVVFWEVLKWIVKN